VLLWGCDLDIFGRVERGRGIWWLQDSTQQIAEGEVRTDKEETQSKRIIMNPDRPFQPNGFKPGGTLRISCLHKKEHRIHENLCQGRGSEYRFLRIVSHAHRKDKKNDKKRAVHGSAAEDRDKAGDVRSEKAWFC